MAYGNTTPVNCGQRKRRGLRIGLEEAIRTGTTELVTYDREGLLLTADEELVYSAIKSLTE